MGADTFAEWLRRQGHKIYQSGSSYWHSKGPRVFQAFPYHQIVSPADDELSEFLRRTKSIGLRYSTPLDADKGQVSYHVVFDKKCMEYLSLPKKVRYDVRNGLDYTRVEPISFSRLANEGWNLCTETMQRQGRMGTETREEWQRLCMSAEGLPGFEAWGAIHDEQLVAAILVFTMDDCASILYQRSATAHLKHGINNALAYVFTNEAASRPGIRRIFYGLHSLDAPASVDTFKFRMGYVAHPVRQRVVFHPLITPLISHPSYLLVRSLVKLLPGSHLLSKAEGMLRFYLQGSRDLAEQEWPVNIIDQRSRLLEDLSI